MLNDQENVSTASKQTDSKEPQKIKELKTIEFDRSAGFVCDIHTGVCGPVYQKEEGKK